MERGDPIQGEGQNQHCMCECVCFSREKLMFLNRSQPFFLSCCHATMLWGCGREGKESKPQERGMDML